MTSFAQRVQNDRRRSWAEACLIRDPVGRPAHHDLGRLAHTDDRSHHRLYRSKRVIVTNRQFEHASVTLSFWNGRKQFGKFLADTAKSQPCRTSVSPLETVGPVGDH